MTREPGHECATCRAGDLRLIDYDRSVVMAPAAVRGPATSMHGGVAAGMVACLGDSHLETPTSRIGLRLHAPPPLETELPLTVDVDPSGQRLTFTVTDATGTLLILTGSASTARGAEGLPPVVDPTEVVRLGGYATPDWAQRKRHDDFVDVEDNPAFYGCFGCGHDNEAGLHLRPRPVDDGVSWAEWTPDLSWVDGDDIASLVAVAALDCPSAFPLKQFGLTDVNDTVLLGSYEAEIRRRPSARLDSSLRLVTSPGDRIRRKIPSRVGLFTAGGDPLVLAAATWIVLAS